MLRFKLFGVFIEVDFWFVALVTFFLLTDQTGVSVFALLACFIHELGHLIMFFAVGYTPKALVFELTGIRLVKPEQALTPWRDVLVQIAGSATNLLVFFLLSGTLNAVSIWSIFAAIHLLLGIFNLFPLKSLDGGKLLFLFCLRLFGERAAEAVAGAADILTTAVLFGIALYSLFSGEQNMTFLFFSSGLFVSLLAKLRGQINITGKGRINIKQIDRKGNGEL